MGGHGGLNILPQKSWNVYNVKNRARVRRDEEKFEEERKQARQEQVAIEQESRLNYLRSGRTVGDEDINHHERARHRHINLFEEEEAEEQQMSRDRSGRNEVEVNDPRFRLGYGSVETLSEQQKPSYLRKRSNYMQDGNELFGSALATSSKKQEKYKQKL